jgi:predicted alpha/beta superfamily hydrolase
MPIDNSNLSLAGTEVRYLQSRHVGDEFKIFIAHPPGGVPSGARLPVIFVLDANGTFGLATDIARVLQSNGVPASYIVGIGYRQDTFAQTMLLRSRDYSPTRFALYEQHFLKARGQDGIAPTGGAPAFLNFIEDELKPYLTEHFPIDMAETTLTGVSFGGLFSSYALLSGRNPFKRYVIASPSLLYDNEYMLRREEQYAQSADDLPATVFIGCGALENEQDNLRAIAAWPEEMRRNWLAMWRPRMVEFVEPFAAALQSRNYPNLRLKCTVFPEETHQSVYPAILSRGLRYVFSS